MLMSLSKEDSKADHVKALAAEIKEKLSDTGGFFHNPTVLKISRFFGFGGGDGDKKLSESLAEPLEHTEAKQLYRIISTQSMLLKHAIDRAKHSQKGAQTSAETASPNPKIEHSASMMSMVQETFIVPSVCESDLRDMKVARHLIILQGIYSEILGPSFRYKPGIQVCECQIVICFE